MNTNYINLQRSAVNPYGCSDKPNNNFGGAIDCNHKQEETNFEKFSKLVSDKVSPVHDKMKDRKQKDVWDEAIDRYKYIGKGGVTYITFEFAEWLKEHYTLTKK